ncbi:transcriptional regulator [Virgisporangium aliadipatigenens]|uniref:Transcriptional regulator n=1 Tax=Virgisporangium aliadipatigenens TaxID=741659 RepID=A0A8J4DNB6_9ACTN|nr:TetR/AcrR family transcriptional regulator [Virgisporangium aliadipatigenens]GIJ44710.1 transcriptional regulator [Virgisporangium aliadipatigenens]
MADDTLPTPPWRTPAKTRPVRPVLSQDGIVDVALRIVATDGVEGVSMRRVAQEFGTGPSSLYAHVANKEELLALMLDRVSAGVELPEPDPARWKEQLRELAFGLFHTLRRYNDLAGASFANVPTSHSALRISEWMMALMTGAGLAPRTAGWALDRLFLYITADVYEGSIYLTRVRRAGTTPDEFAKAYFGQLHDYMASLPADRFPMMSAHAGAMTEGDGDVRFAFGLDLILDGLDRHLDSAG